MPSSHAAVDRRSGAPLYAQIADDLRRQIRSGTRPPGSPLPTEQSLQEIYGVSRSVVRQALDILAQDRLISREQGRGTIVLPTDHHRRRAREAGGLRQQIAALGGELSTRIITLELLSPDVEVAAVLGDHDVWRLERVRSVDGEPTIHMVTWIPQRLAPTLSQATLGGGSLHDWMRAHGLSPKGGPRQLRAAAAEPSTAAFLDVDPGSPVTLLEGETRDASGRVLEMFSAWHHPRTVFDLDAEVDRSDATSRAEELLSEIRSMLTE